MDYSKLKLSVVFYFLLFFVCGLQAQNIGEIKNNPLYYSAEGKGVTVDEADRDALGQISRQISVSIASKTEYSETSNKENNASSYSQSQSASVSSVSFSSLQNVNMLVLSPEPEAVVFRWVEKSEVEKMFEQRKQKIIDFVSTGKKAEQNLQIDDALRNYYWALMLAKTNDSPVYAEFNGKNENCLTFLPLKINSVIANIKAELKSCTEADGRYYATVRFAYNGQDVSSIQFRYFDGQSYVGPMVARDGIAEVDLVSLPFDNKIKILYEYMFRKEAENLDAELRAVFSDIKPTSISNASTGILVKVDAGKKTMASASAQQTKKENIESNNVSNIAPEPTKTRKVKELEKVENTDQLLASMRAVEESIRTGEVKTAYSHFTVEGYKMFDTLLNKTGKVSLVGGNQEYEFVNAGGQILARFCKVKIRFSNGKSFMENLVFRFNSETKKIESLAFALTKKAEEDIFNADASLWTDVSRFAILQFMEDYQTAYALRRLDYLESVFSDDALIITGTVLKKAPTQKPEGSYIDLGGDDVKYTKQTKQEYLSNLNRHFKSREYIHLTFEDNTIKVLNAPRIQPGTAFAIQINQLYNSPTYSDKGYLTLVLDASEELPIIHVRLWQPEKADMMSLDDFMGKFEF